MQLAINLQICSNPHIKISSYPLIGKPKFVTWETGGLGEWDWDGVGSHVAVGQGGQ